MPFADAPEAELLAMDLIPAHHPHLEAARVAYLYTDEPIRRQGRDLAGRVQTVGAVLGHFAKADFLAVLHRPTWALMTDAQRTALVDHLLCGCVGQADKDGEIRWGLRAPDFAEFREIVERHGLWQKDLKLFAEAARPWMQQELPLAEAGTEGAGANAETVGAPAA